MIIENYIPVSVAKQIVQVEDLVESWDTGYKNRRIILIQKNMGYKFWLLFPKRMKKKNAALKGCWDILNMFHIPNGGR